jgi:hypothetical protein
MIPAEQRDKNLRENLLEELPGILAWIIEGAKAYLARGLQDLPGFTEATKSLRDSCDDLGRWLETCVEHGTAVPRSVFHLLCELPYLERRGRQHFRESPSRSSLSGSVKRASRQSRAVG